MPARSHPRRHSSRRHVAVLWRRALVVAVAVAVATTLLPWVHLSSARAGASTITTCSHNQLDVVTASPSGAYVAAGNNGIPFYIVNISTSSCSLDGYAQVSFSPQSYRGTSLRVVHGGGMIFAAARPRLVILRPGFTASFGIDFGDAANQQDPSGASCTTSNANIKLPVRNPDGYDFRPRVSFNFCFTGFLVTLTPIEAGPIPKLG